MVAAGCLCLAVPGVLMLTGWSRQMLQTKTYPVGDGWIAFMRTTLKSNKPGNSSGRRARNLAECRPAGRQTLLVLPDGEMINYLARMRSPVAPAFFFSSATSDGRETGIVRDLEHNPPDWIVIISRDLPSSAAALR